MYICGFFTRAKRTARREFIYIFSAAPPPPPPLYNVGHVHTLEVQHCMGGKGGKQRILKRKTVLFLKLRFKHTQN